MKMPRSNMPAPADRWVIAAMAAACLCLLASFASTRLVLTAIADLGAAQSVFHVIAVLIVAATAVLFWPALRSLQSNRLAAKARHSNDAVQARIATADARDKAQITLAANGEITITAEGALKLKGASIELEATKIKLDGDDVAITAGGHCGITAKKVDIN